MDFRILGPLEASENGRVLPLGAPKERVLLASLLLRANRVVATDRLIEVLWGASPPGTARATLQTYVLRLRRALQPSRGAPSPPLIVTRPPGYVLQVRPEGVDLHRFERLVAEARAAMAGGGSGQAAELLRQALGLWHGPALGDVASMSPLLMGEAARLEEARHAALEERIEAELALGWHARLVGELEALVVEQPLRERAHGQLMLALYRSGRQAEALAVYQAARQVFHDELGLEPGRELQRLQQQILAADASLELPGPAAAPSPATARAVPAQLPADVADFTGRAEDLRQLDCLLATRAELPTTAVVISAIAGTAGVGKTALAVHWGHQVRGQFPDGQLYVDLRGYAPTPPVRPIQALAMLLHALGVPAEQVPVEIDEAAGLYRSLMADRRLLVLLDNARSPDQVRPLLPASPGCMVLVTSRDRLAGLVAMQGARRLTLDTLTLGEARELLERIVGKRRVAAEPQATTELARSCALLPLALRIAAASLTDQPQRGIADYVAELGKGNRLAALEITGDQQAKVRAAFDLSYNALDPAGQRLFRLLGLVPGHDVTPGATAALAGSTSQQAWRLLDRLAGAHLLSRRGPNRFGFHDLLRLYAAERAHHDDLEQDRRAAIRRLLEWYLRTVDAAARLLYPEMLRLPLPTADTQQPTTRFEEHTQARAWLDAERPNLVSAVQHAAAHGPLPAAWLIADALRGYLVLRAYAVDWLAVAQAGLAAAEADGDLRAQAAAQLSLADVHQRQSQHQKAIEHYTRMLVLSRQTGWLDGQATALGSLGCVHWQSGRLHEAADHLTQALALSRQTGRLAAQAASLTNLGAVHQELGRLEQAANYHSQALALDQEAGSRRNEAADRANLGETLHALGWLDQAFDHLTTTLAEHREVGDRAGEADSLRALAAIHLDAGHLTDALQLADAAIALARDTGERRIEAEATNVLAAAHRHLGEHARAVDGHHRALGLARETSHRHPEAAALIGLAAAHQQLDHLDQALNYANQALTLARRAGYRILEGQALTAHAGLCLDQGRADQAAEHARRALDLHREAGYRLGEARTLLVLGHARRHTDGEDAAIPCWQRALAVFAEIGAPETDEVRALTG
jgi:DNA-binding SARP family transcriptional activator